jgi:hypothetical protein
MLNELEQKFPIIAEHRADLDDFIIKKLNDNTGFRNYMRKIKGKEEESIDKNYFSVEYENENENGINEDLTEESEYNFKQYDYIDNEDRNLEEQFEKEYEKMKLEQNKKHDL